MSTEGRASSRAVLVGLLGAAGWLLVHFLLYMRVEWWSAPFEGEWDILLPARAFAAGEVPRTAIGTIHGFEIGSYGLAAVAGLFVRLGVDPTHASRYLAAAVGASGAGVVVGGTWLLSSSAPPRRRLLGAAVAALLVCFCWPHWHFQNLGVTGTTLESSVLLAALFVTLTAGTASSRRSATLGLLFAAACLFSPLALAALPILVLSALVRADLGRRQVAAFGGGVVVLPGLIAVGLPGGLAALGNVSWSWLGLWGQASISGVAGSANWTPAQGLWATAPTPFFGTPWPVLAIVVGILIPIVALGSLGNSRSAPQHRRLAGYVVYWGLLLSLLPRTASGQVEGYRYWSIYLLLGLVAVGLGITRLRGRWAVGLGALVTGAALVGAVAAPRALPPPGRSMSAVMTTLGSHRTPERLGGREGTSDRHGTFIDLVEHMPSAHRPAFAQGYGIAIAEDLWPPGITDWWSEWNLATLRPHVTVDVWAAFVFGLGCGHAVLPEVNARREELMRQLLTQDASAYGLGFGWCEPHGPRVTRPMPHLATAASDCRSYGRVAGPALGLDDRGADRETCGTRVRPAVPDLWTYLRLR